MADFFGIDIQWHPEGSFYGVDGKYHAANESYGVDGEYHPPGQVYAPALGADGKMVTYRPAGSPFKIEGGVPPYGSPGSFLGVDGKRSQSGWYYGLDGQYHHPETRYDFMTGKYTEPPKPKP